MASDKLYRSDDRGDTWTTISGQLSRGLDRDKLPVMGKVWGIDAVAKNASTAFFGNASALAESPKKDGLIYVGTDDGLLQVTEDGGKNWRKIEKFPGVPDMSYVSRVITSNYDANTAFVSFDNHQSADFKPYLLKTTDAGRTWVSLSSNLPKMVQCSRSLRITSIRICFLQVRNSGCSSRWTADKSGFNSKADCLRSPSPI
jgi:hypothetical protein